MIAQSFWSSTLGLSLILGAVFAAVFLVSTFLGGTRARARRQQRLEQRIGKRSVAVQDQARSARWVPASLAGVGGRVATAAGFSARLDQRLEQAGIPIAAGEFVALTALCALVGAVVAAIFLVNIVFILAISAVAGMIPRFMMVRAHRNREKTLVEQLADTLAILASSLRAGYSFLQALDTVSKEIGEPSAGEFQRVVAEIRLGRPIDDAMLAMADRVNSDDLRWAVIAINVQRQVGGNLAEVLDTVAGTVRERAYIRRQINVLSAEGKLSVAILAALPFLIMLYIAVVNPGYLEPLFTTTFGIALSIGGLLWMLLGIFVMTRMVKIDV